MAGSSVSSTLPSTSAPRSNQNPGQLALFRLLGLGILPGNPGCYLDLGLNGGADGLNLVQQLQRLRRLHPQLFGGVGQGCRRPPPAAGGSPPPSWRRSGHSPGFPSERPGSWCPPWSGGCDGGSLPGAPGPGHDSARSRRSPPGRGDDGGDAHGPRRSSCSPLPADSGDRYSSFMGKNLPCGLNMNI